MARGGDGGNDDTNIYLSYSLPRLITTSIRYSFTSYFWDLYIKEFDWSPTDYGELYWIYTLTQIISYLSLGYIFHLVIEDLLSDIEERLKRTKWIEIGSIILLSDCQVLYINIVHTIIWNLLCRARTTARNYSTPYETYPFEKAERNKRIRIIRSMFPDLRNPLPRSSPSPNSELLQLVNLAPKPDHNTQPIQIIGTLPSPSIPFWPRFWQCLCTPFKIIWNLLCRARTTARNYLTPYESYPAENAERQKRLRIIRSMFPELANPLPQPEPNIESYSDPIVNTLPKPSLLSRMRSLFKPKSKLRSPYEFPFSPVEFGGVPDLTATWTMVWYKSPDPLVPDAKYKPSLRERFNYFRNRGSYNMAKYDPPVPEMYIPPEPEPIPKPSISKSTPTSPPPPIPPIKREPKHEPIEQLPEPKSIPNPIQGPIPYITPGPPPEDNIPAPEPIPELDPIPGPKLNMDDIPYITPDTPAPLLQGDLIAEPISKATPPPTIEPEPPPLPPNIPLRNNRTTKAYPNSPESPFRPIELVLRLIVSKRFILYVMTALHSIGTSSFDLCNKALTTYIYPGKINYDANETSRNNINALSVGFFIGTSFLIILLFSLVKNLARSKTAFAETFFAISLLSFLGQVPVLHFFHSKTTNEGTTSDDSECPQLCAADYLKLFSLTTFHATTMFWIFMGGLLTNYVFPNTIGGNVSIMGFIVSIIVVGFPVISWLHIGVATFISDTCTFLFNYGDGQIIMMAACIIGQSAVCYLFDSHNYWWNVESILQFFILIIMSIANLIFLIHTYVMFDNVLKKKTVNDLKWLMIGIFYSITGLVTYSAIYIMFNSYYNNQLIESMRSLTGWIHNYDFPTIYKLITFIFQLANAAAFAIYYLVHSCDMHQKRLENERKIRLEVSHANYTAHRANTIALSASTNADSAKKEANYANQTANEAKKVAEEAKTTATEARKYAKDAVIVAAYALEVAVYALKVSAWAQTVATGALNLASSAKNLALDALNFAINALNFAGNAYRDASWTRLFAEDAKRDASYAKMISTDAQIDAKIARLFAEDALKDASQAKIQATWAQIDAKIARLFAEDAQMIAADAQAYTTSAIKFAVDALNHASSAQEDASQAKTIASSAQMIAENAKGASLWARIFAGDALSYASSAKEDTENAKRDASQAIKVANNAITTANEAERKASAAENTANTAKDTANEVKKSLEAVKNIAKAFSKVEREDLQKKADKFQQTSSRFSNAVTTFYAEAQNIDAKNLTKEPVKTAITAFQTAAAYFGYKEEEEKGDISTVKKFLDFSDALKTILKSLPENTCGSNAGLNIKSILSGFLLQAHDFKIAANHFSGEADEFYDEANQNFNGNQKEVIEKFRSAAHAFKKAAEKFVSIGKYSQEGVANVFRNLANALSAASQDCEELKDQAESFKETVQELETAATEFNRASADFSREADKFYDLADEIEPTNIRAGNQLKDIRNNFIVAADYFKTTAERLYEAIKVLV